MARKHAENHATSRNMDDFKEMHAKYGNELTSPRYLHSSRSHPASDVQLGDRVKSRHLTMIFAGSDLIASEFQAKICSGSRRDERGCKLFASRLHHIVADIGAVGIVTARHASACDWRLFRSKFTGFTGAGSIYQGARYITLHSADLVCSIVQSASFLNLIFEDSGC